VPPAQPGSEADPTGFHLDGAYLASQSDACSTGWATLCCGDTHAQSSDQLLDGRLLIAEAGLEQDKRSVRNRAKAEAARKVAEQQGGVYWIGTEATLSKTRHANLVFLHARRQTFPAWQELEEALQIIWPWGEVACVQEMGERLGERWSQAEREAAA
jgi:hypothetical protein